MHSSSRSTLGTALCCLTVTALVACGSAHTPETGTPPSELTTAPASEYDLTGVPGSVLEYEDFGGAGTDSTLYRVVYESTSGIDGSPTAVSGVAAVPAGAVPEGGWPIVVYGHGTTGVSADCGPTLSPDLLGYLSAVQFFTELGYVTVLPDYQGLGTGGGTHPYLEPRTAGNSMIDAARAVHGALPETSTRWAAVGLSQGGQAAWAATELVETYGQGLELVGTVALSPPTDVTPLVDAASTGTLTDPQKELMPYVLYGAQQVEPGLDVSQYTRSVAEANTDLLLSCTDDNRADKARVIAEMTPDEFSPTSKESGRQLEEVLGSYTLPQVNSTVPMLVVYGGLDDIVLPQWTAAAVERACALGHPVIAELQPGSGHDVDPSSATEFLADRFAGLPPTPTC